MAHPRERQEELRVGMGDVLVEDLLEHEAAARAPAQALTAEVADAVEPRRRARCEDRDLRKRRSRLPGKGDGF